MVFKGKVSIKRAIRSCMAGVATIGLLAACADEQAAGLGEVGYVGGFYGAAVSDEPQATLIGQDILSAGGSAGDAAIAMGFALGVTMPTRAGLGSIGQCMVHDVDLGVTEVVDFLPVQSTNGRIPAPTFARGMAALHARYGTLDWRQLIAPAEQLARLGHRPSRASRNEIEPLWEVISRDPLARVALGGSSGGPISANDRWRQVELASILGQIRVRGAGAMYTGTLARAVVDTYNAYGAGIDLASIQSYAAEWRFSVSAPFGRHLLHVPPYPNAAGLVIAQSLLLGERQGQVPDIQSPDQFRVSVQTLGDSLAGFPGWGTLDPEDSSSQEVMLGADRLDAIRAFDFDSGSAGYPGLKPLDRGSTGYVVVDNRGMAVACTLSLQRPTGAGRMAPGLGFYPSAPYDGVNWHAPVIVANAENFLLYYVAAGEGGTAGLASIVQTTQRAYRDGILLGDVMEEARAVADPITKSILLEERAADPFTQALGEFGVRIQKGRALGRVNAVYCPSGLPVEIENRRCGAESDSRGSGLAGLAE